MHVRVHVYVLYSYRFGVTLDHTEMKATANVTTKSDMHEQKKR